MLDAHAVAPVRRAFLAACGVPPDEPSELATALDDVLTWSAEVSDALVLLPAGDQATVGVGLAATGDVLWRVYPRQRDGAKIVVLPGIFDALAADSRAILRASFDEAVPGGEFATAGYLQGTLGLLADDIIQRQFRVALAGALAALRAHRTVVAT